MSSRPCNKCLLESLQKGGATISVRKDPHDAFPHGVRVTRRPRSGADEEFLAWFAKVPTRCAC